MEPIETPRRPVTKTIGGITFEDPYAWLVPDTEETSQWQREQVAKAVESVRGIPGFDELVEAIQPRLQNVLAGMLGMKTQVAGRWFWLGTNDLGTAAAVRVSDDRDGPGRVLVDAGVLTEERGDGRPTTLVYLEPSPDGRLVAFSQSAGGEPTGVYGVVDVATARRLDVAAPTMQGNGVRPAWLPDGSGFFLQGRAADGRHQLRFTPVRAGTPERPPAVFDFADVPMTAPALVSQVSPGGRQVVAVTMPHEHVASTIGDLETGQWRRFVPPGFVGELHGDWLDDDTYIAIATDTPRGRIVAVPAATSTDPETWTELVPASELVLRSLQVVQGRLVVSALDDVSLDLRVYEPDGKPVGRAELPPATASMGLVGPGRVKPRTDAFVFSASTFTTTETTYQLDVSTAALEVVEPGDTLDGIGVEQFFAISSDGTEIPYFVVAREDLDRSIPGPTLVSAYGGFNVPLIPGFLAENTPFVQAGGSYVQASLRGGSEYGREWYEAGRLRSKQNVFDDLRAVAEDLITRGIATPETLAFHGSSNGGLLAGVAITQQAELWRAVVPQVPVLDVLEPLTDGPAADAIRAIYAEDYGHPADPDDARTMYAYSPCHNVRDGVAYPAVLGIFGQLDIGCPPGHGRRFTAALQHATTSGRPVLLRVWEDVGHGSLDPDITARQYAECFAFVMRELGML